MLESFQSRNAKDFRQRYNASWGYYTIEGSKKRILVQMIAVGEERADFIDEGGVAYHAWADQGVEFEFIPVQKKLFVHNDKLLFVRRNPSRMWSRGVNTQNTLISEVKYGSRVYLSFEVIRAAFEAPPAEINREKPAYILSDAFGVQDNVLYVYNEKLGKIKGSTIKLDNNLFRQEILDLVFKHNLNLTVENG